MNTKTALTLLTLLVSVTSLKSQCGREGETVIIKFQEDVVKLAGCQSFNGSMRFESNGVLDLSPLASLKRIDGNLSIIQCTSLRSVAGLQSLSSIGGDLVLMGNTGIETFEHLSSLTEVGGKLEFSSNHLVNDLDGLTGIKNIGGDLIIRSNAFLTETNLTGLEQVDGSFMLLGHHTHLKNLTGMERLQSISGSMVIQSLGMNSLTGLENVSYVGENVMISGTQRLNNLRGLNSLREIGGSMMITDNQVLGSLEGLGSLIGISGDLFVTGNPSLTGCCDLSKLMSMQYITGEIKFENNSHFCNTEDQVLETCHTDADDLTIGKAVMFHPSGGKVTVMGMNNPTVRLYDLSGNEIWRARQTEMDMRNQKAGLFMLRVTDGETGQTMQRKIFWSGM